MAGSNLAKPDPFRSPAPIHVCGAAAASLEPSCFPFRILSRSFGEKSDFSPKLRDKIRLGSRLVRGYNLTCARARPWRMKFFNFARELEKSYAIRHTTQAPPSKTCAVEYKWLRFGRLMNFCIAELFERDETLLVITGNYCSCALRKV